MAPGARSLRGERQEMTRAKSGELVGVGWVKRSETDRRLSKMMGFALRSTHPPCFPFI
jgi:hypothetical protein